MGPLVPQGLGDRVHPADLEHPEDQPHRSAQVRRHLQQVREDRGDQQDQGDPLFLASPLCLAFLVHQACQEGLDDPVGQCDQFDLVCPIITIIIEPICIAKS